MASIAGRRMKGEAASRTTLGRFAVASPVDMLVQDGSSASLTSGEDAASPLSGSTLRFDLRLTRDQQARWNLIKVTRRGFFSTEPSVTLKPRKPGLYIIVK